jgi:hypothetical protein
MALDPIKTGDKIAAKVQALTPVAGTPVTINQLKILWEEIITILYTDIKSDAVVNSTGTGKVISGPGINGDVTTTDIGVIT